MPINQSVKEVIEMVNVQRSSLITMSLLLGAGVLIPVGSQPRCGDEPRVILAGDMMQVAETPTTWAIRPADEKKSLTQLPGHQSAISAGASAPPLDVMSSEIQTLDGIRYVSGGIGESERTELKAIGREFNLHLMFATQGSGKYLSAVRVNILDARSNPVLTVVSNGPWFLAQLPAGQYRVEVTPTGKRGKGETQGKTVNLGSEGQAQMDFYWKI
ncbi:carboxypeptidase-like regulatory domain-containing protein [Thiorhodovibrio winogradskyi]|uniref:carboxypeptidase-like regulatory domain-containing protein n=1 Tax=Thiorhodovibrio winogradskyi TaxID=77007 RepID=UPI002E2C3180|nr:carboxypeptidase regulatory-like domain-containing protein [Thiorhodovibrio winogradskyi]